MKQDINTFLPYSAAPVYLCNWVFIGIWCPVFQNMEGPYNPYSISKETQSSGLQDNECYLTVKQVLLTTGIIHNHIL